MESNGLLPQSQCGFKQQISTMSVLAELQQKWAENKEIEEMT
jgi:hypothetical protein